MALLKKNWAIILIILMAALLVILVIWVYDQRISQLEKPFTHTRTEIPDTRAFVPSKINLCKV